MTDLQQTIDRYVAIWNGSDDSRRRELIEATWTEDGRYLDPVMSGSGHAGFDAMVQGVRAQLTRHRIERTTAIDAHNDRARFGWALVNEATGGTVNSGVDFVQLAPDGRLSSITGFFDHVADENGGNDE